MLTGTINALTTFNQRRLLMHQVETSFLLKPYSGKHEDEEDKDKKRLAEARRAKSSRKKQRILDDTSSEEDFFFLEKALNETNELDEVDQRLLMGIIQAPPKEKKRWDKEDPEEARRRRKEKAIARGEQFSDSYDDETEGNEREDEMHSEFEQLRIASQTNVRLRKESIIADYESQEERARQRYQNSTNDLRDSLAKLSKV